ncbi:hypothetical protein ACVJGD_003179 [Bradyrhizobium sp. USDA 10063]
MHKPRSRRLLDAPPSRGMTAVGATPPSTLRKQWWARFALPTLLYFFAASFFIAALIDEAASS